MSILYSGIWSPWQGPRHLFTDATLQNFQNQWKSFRDTGFHLVSLDTSEHVNGPRWTGVFAKNGDTNTEFKADLTLNEVVQIPQNRDVKCLTAYMDGNNLKYAVALADGTTSCTIEGNLQQSDFIQSIRSRRNSNEHLFDMQTTSGPDGRRWVGLWKEVTTPGFEDRVWMDGDDAHLKSNNLTFAGQGCQPIRLKSYRSAGRTRYAGIWHKGAPSSTIFTDLNFANLRDRKREFVNQMQLAEADARSIDDGMGDGSAGDRVNIRILFAQRPPQTINSLVGLAKRLFLSHRIHLSLEDVSELPSSFVNVQLFPCEPSNHQLSPQHQQLLNMRTGFGPKDIGVYFAGHLQDSIGPLRGCAVGNGIVLNAGEMSDWTLPHEICHILGLGHVNSNHNLMFHNTGAIQTTVSLPELSSGQVSSIKNNSRFIIRSA